MKRSFAQRTLTALVAASALCVLAVTPAAAIDDPVVSAARAAGDVGEQADGFLGAVSGHDINADLRARIDQINIERRAYFTQLASQNNATVNEMARAIACHVFAERVKVGEYYRDENQAWRQHTASAPVAMPSYCPQ